jgi:pimeloyl-ACP methyl ester carboxylesterase
MLRTTIGLVMSWPQVPMVGVRSGSAQATHGDHLAASQGAVFSCLLVPRGAGRDGFGGPWELTWAIAHPEAFGSVTFINIGVMLDYRWHYLARIWRTPILGELSMATTTPRVMHLLLKRGNPRGLPQALIDRMYDDFDHGTHRAVLKLYRATGDLAVTARRMAEALRQIPRPALVVWGKHDPYVPIAFAERQREVFPDAQVVIMEGSGHWPFADDPDGVARVVIPFLRQLMGHEAAGEPW